MGDKGLKAIAVRGTKDVHIARRLNLWSSATRCRNTSNSGTKIRFGVMPILAGLGSPQEMAVHDEKWHTENFMWGNRAFAEKISEQGHRSAVDGNVGQNAHPVDQLL